MRFLRFLRPRSWWKIVKQARLIWRLIRDPQVPIYLKALPLAGFLYLVIPIDLIPIAALPIDDITIIFSALTAFLQFAPQERVTHHQQNLGLQQEDMVI